MKGFHPVGDAGASTGPRSGERGDPSRPVPRFGHLLLLQRGRARESAEIPSRSDARRRSSSCFNGAALGRARRCRGPAPPVGREGLLQRGRARESAEMNRDAATGWPRRTRFNGAALGRARRYPRPPRLAPCARTRFNGAALGRARRSHGRSQPFGRSRPASTGPRSGERGDASSGPDLRRGHATLQRGRARESAEIRALAIRPGPRQSASTGPRSGERGDHSWFPGVAQSQGASTGPRSGERGDLEGQLVR